ncbi:MAG: hypothetical protein ACP5VP_11180 [Candidatus Limnocylindrales bacterium]
MDRAGQLDTCAAKDRLRGEIDDVRAAIALVARGTSTRVTISDLAFGEQLLVRLAPEARLARVTLIPLWWPDDAGCDLTVRRVDD